jgi:two-component system OmpR family response regulator
MRYASQAALDMDDPPMSQWATPRPSAPPTSALSPTVLLVGRPVFLERMSAILRGAGFSDEWARSEAAARVMLDSGPIGLVVVDGGMSTPTDFSACSRLAQRAGCPVIMMTTGDDDCERILALELGADDCMSASWRPAELLARTRAALRRGYRLELSPGSDRSAGACFGEWRLDLRARRVFRPDGQWARFGSIDAIILECLVQNGERLTTPSEIIQASVSAGRPLTENHLRVQISRLRGKLGRDSRGRMAILSVRTRGYALVQDSPSAAPDVSRPPSIMPLRPVPSEASPS